MTIKGKSREEYGNLNIDREGLQQAFRAAKQYKGNQVSGVKNGVAKLVGDGEGGIMYENPYLLDEVTVSAPDMRIAKAAQKKMVNFPVLIVSQNTTYSLQMKN